MLPGGTLGAALKKGEGAPGLAAQTLAPVALRSPASDPRFTPETYGENAGKITELIALPICDFNGELKGVLELVNARLLRRIGVVVFALLRPEPGAPMCVFLSAFSRF